MCPKMRAERPASSGALIQWIPLGSGAYLAGTASIAWGRSGGPTVRRMKGVIVPLICVKCQHEAKDAKALLKSGGKIVIAHGLRAICPNGHDMGAFDPSYIPNAVLRKAGL